MPKPLDFQRLQAAEPKLMEIGRFHKGTKKQDAVDKNGKPYKTYGKDLEYFRFEPDDRLRYLPSASHANLYEELTEKWRSLEEVTFGWKAIPVLLPYKNLRQNWWWRNGSYDSTGRCVRACDGRTCSKYQVNATNSKGKPYKAVIEGAIPCSFKDGMDKCPEGCTPEGKLSIIVPGLYPGMILVTTKSSIDITTIEQNLKAYASFDLSRIPMRLCRSLRDASYRTPDGEYKQQQKWLLHLEIDPEYGRLALQAQQDQYRAELTGDRTYALAGSSQRSLPSARIPSFRNSQGWEWFEGAIAQAIQSGDAERLSSVANSAYDWARTLDRSMRSQAEDAIAREYDQALAALGDRLAPVTAAAVAEPAHEVVWAKFCGMIDRAKGDDGRQEQAIAWLKTEKQWEVVKGTYIEEEAIAFFNALAAQSKTVEAPLVEAGVSF